MIKLFSWIPLVLFLTLPAFAAPQVRLEPNAGLYYFTDLDNTSIGSGISLSILKEAGTVQRDDSLLGVKFGLNFVNPEIESIANSRVTVCTTVSSYYRTTTTCQFIPVEETVHLTNLNVSWLAETEYSECIKLGFEMGLDLWSSNLSTSDLGVRLGTGLSYTVRKNINLKIGAVYSGLAEAKMHGQEIDLSNVYSHFGFQWRF